MWGLDGFSRPWIAFKRRGRNLNAEPYIACHPGFIHKMRFAPVWMAQDGPLRGRCPRAHTRSRAALQGRDPRQAFGVPLANGAGSRSGIEQGSAWLCRAPVWMAQDGPLRGRCPRAHTRSRAALQGRDPRQAFGRCRFMQPAGLTIGLPTRCRRQPRYRALWPAWITRSSPLCGGP